MRQEMNTQFKLEAGKTGRGKDLSGLEKNQIVTA